jgi:hypothetical protein
MKKLLSGVVVAAIVAVAWPAWSQSSTTQGQSTQQNAPGTGGPSKPGVSGLPGGQIRPDGDALWYNCARSNPEPAKWGSEQGSRTPQQQIRADGQTVGCPVAGHGTRNWISPQ